ncbi:hypothetical protein DLR60_05155 [Vibrio tarriae]|nr:hypothetical protein [Vibrio cholerae]RBM70254.1 hypothetical protein DLR60_05155 [Vibrio tarriae]TQP55063.1 hypothetical protein FLL81_18025 [Vibrio cholerae]
MIRSLKLADVATYDTTGVHLSNLKKINFIYGANGCGKTTAFVPINAEMYIAHYLYTKIVEMILSPKRR